MVYEQEYLAQYAESVPGLISHTEVKYLMSCAWKAPLFPMVELGPYQGKSTCAISAVASRRGLNIVTIDNFEWAFRFGPSNVEVVLGNVAPFGADIRVLVQDSRKVPNDIGKIGFLFTDTTHTAPHLDAEFDVWLPHIVKGGVVAIHDHAPGFPDVARVANARFGDKDWERIGLVDTLIAFQRR